MFRDAPVLLWVYLLLNSAKGKKPVCSSFTKHKIISIKSVRIWVGNGCSCQHCYLKWKINCNDFLYTVSYTIDILSFEKCTLFLIWRSWDHALLMYSFKYTNEMQRYTIFFIAVNALHVSGSFSAHHQELKTVHTASGICQDCLLLLLAWVSWNCSNSPMLVVGASKLDIYQMLYVQFWAPDDGRRNCLKRVEHWQQ